MKFASQLSHKAVLFMMFAVCSAANADYYYNSQQQVARGEEFRGGEGGEGVNRGQQGQNPGRNDAYRPNNRYPNANRNEANRYEENRAYEQGAANSAGSGGNPVYVMPPNSTPTNQPSGNQNSQWGQ